MRVTSRLTFTAENTLNSLSSRSFWDRIVIHCVQILRLCPPIDVEKSDVNWKFGGLLFSEFQSTLWTPAFFIFALSVLVIDPRLNTDGAKGMATGYKNLRHYNFFIKML